MARLSILHIKAKTLLDLAFIVLNMLARDRVIFLDDHFFGHGAGIFLGHVKVAGVCG